ncbi:hypothetical protein Rhe02_10580 [Rhizocola hellebori]|uniref:Uncharacterized protein n=2 Tax=Rhizocola hellebori TaxID=1392758 RepID=A0A8J3Q412_9ACTN|nr:hypothetical protein Rhe02_10580 [Rhizocola hellebori]
MLAGERWSDRPACTHPLLAAVARHVNDHTSEVARQRLAVLIPSVIGLTGDDLHIDVRVALRCATAALPVVSAERQRGMAIAVLTAHRLQADLNGQPAVEGHQVEELAGVPAVARQARRFMDDLRVNRDEFRRRIAPSIVSDAIRGIAQADGLDPDPVLRDLLIGAIEDCRAQVGLGAQAAAAL